MATEEHPGRKQLHEIRGRLSYSPSWLIGELGRYALPDNSTAVAYDDAAVSEKGNTE